MPSHKTYTEFHHTGHTENATTQDTGGCTQYHRRTIGSVSSPVVASAHRCRRSADVIAASPAAAILRRTYLHHATRPRVSAKVPTWGDNQLDYW